MEVIGKKEEVRSEVAFRFCEKRFLFYRLKSKRVCDIIKSPMVYVKWFPRHAYPEKFTAITQWAWGISMLCIGVLFIITVIVA